MMHFIERLQQKPEAARRRIALGVSLIVIFVIGGIWISTFTGGRSDPLLSEREGITPIASSFESLQRVGQNFLKSIQGIGEYSAPQE